MERLELVVQLFGPSYELVQQLAQSPQTVGELTRQSEFLDRKTALLLLTDLESCGLISRVDDEKIDDDVVYEAVDASLLLKVLEAAEELFNRSQSELQNRSEVRGLAVRGARQLMRRHSRPQLKGLPGGKSDG